MTFCHLLYLLLFPIILPLSFFSGMEALELRSVNVLWGVVMNRWRGGNEPLGVVMNLWGVVMNQVGGNEPSGW